MSFDVPSQAVGAQHLTAEMWNEVRFWLGRTGAIPQDPEPMLAGGNWTIKEWDAKLAGGNWTIEEWDAKLAGGNWTIEEWDAIVERVNAALSELFWSCDPRFPGLVAAYLQPEEDWYYWPPPVEF